VTVTKIATQTVLADVMTKNALNAVAKTVTKIITMTT
jgi:hypothetical protein